jgi:hypothetical protein
VKIPIDIKERISEIKEIYTIQEDDDADKEQNP